MCDLEDRKIHIRFGGARSGVDGRRNLQIISCSSSCNAAVLHEVLGSEEKGTKDAEEQESSANELPVLGGGVVSRVLRKDGHGLRSFVVGAGVMWLLSDDQNVRPLLRDEPSSTLNGKTPGARVSFGACVWVRLLAEGRRSGAPWERDDSR